MQSRPLDTQHPAHASLSAEAIFGDPTPIQHYPEAMNSAVSGITLAEVAALMGDVARANILSALMDGRALTAGELAWHAKVSAQTTSGHLGKLLEGRLVAVERQGRHRYYRLGSPQVAQAIEGLMILSSHGPARHRPVGPRDLALRAARTCYDHLAGRLGVALADSLAAHEHVVLQAGAGAVTESGVRFLRDFGIELGADSGGSRHQRTLCRLCLDWSERRPHLAGRLGASLYARCLEIGWVTRLRDSRAATITDKGRAGFEEIFQISCASVIEEPPS
jgi:DNA-binding transcriptional ArsR family regulator